MSPAFEPLESRRGEALGPALLGPFVPLLILALVLLAWFGFQTLQLRSERAAMNELQANQEAQVQQSKKLRDALDALARGTATLADGGNPNARALVDELKKRGVNINANPAGPVPGEPRK